MKVFFSGLILASLAVIYSLTYHYNLGATPIFIRAALNSNDPNKLFNVSFDFYNSIYM